MTGSLPNRGDSLGPGRVRQKNVHEYTIWRGRLRGVCGNKTVPQLFDEICRLVAEGHYLIGDHAWERLLERGIMEWQVIAGMAEARLITERRLARPNPIVEMQLPLPNGDDCKVVWSLLRREGVAKLVTAHLLGDEEFCEEG
jgi:hypothetical protein